MQENLRLAEQDELHDQDPATSHSRWRAQREPQDHSTTKGLPDRQLRKPMTRRFRVRDPASLRASNVAEQIAQLQREKEREETSDGAEHHQTLRRTNLKKWLGLASRSRFRFGRAQRVPERAERQPENAPEKHQA